MHISRSLSRLALTVATLVGGLAMVSTGTSSASPETMATNHTGRVLFPTVGAAHAARLHHAASVVRNATSYTLSAHGGIDGIEVTTGTPKVYVVFYGSQWGTETTNGSGYDTFSGDPQGMAPRLQALLAGIGTNGELWSGVMTQYCDGVANGTTVCPSGAQHVGYPTGGALAGVWYDNSVASLSQSTGEQLAAEAVAAAGHFGNTTAALNRSAQYVIVSPTGTHPDGFNTASGNFCAWHDYNGDTTLSGGAAASSYGDVAFTNLPYIPDMGASCGANYVNAGTAGTLDGVSIVEGHEYAETLTDQNAGYGWYDNATGYENGDTCAWVGTGGTGGAQNVAFATGSLPMQATWSNSNKSCEISDPIVTAVPSDFSIAASPTSGSVSQGTKTTVAVSTAVTAGSAESVALSVSGLPTGASASFSPSSVNSGGSSTLTLSTTSSTPVGSYPLTITGTASSGSHTAGYTLTVTAAVPSDFSIAASPTSGSVSQGTKTTVAVSTAVTAGSAESVALSVSGLPTGASASFSPSSVNSGGSSTLTLSTTSSTPVGSYPLTITGTASSGSHTAGYTLTVTAAVANTFSLSLSPTSGTTNLGGSVSTTVSTATTSGSAQSVKLTVSGLPSGVSASFTTSTVTSGNSTKLTIITSRRSTAGSYTITVKGTGTSSSASATYLLKD